MTRHGTTVENRPPELGAVDSDEALAPIGTPELVGRTCRLTPYHSPGDPSPIHITTELVAYASPDSTWAVTKRLLDGAQHSILVGIYDFKADYVLQTLKDALGRGVTVTMMLDLDGRTGEREQFDELATAGATCVPAPSCASDRARYFASSHEKVIVIDDTWTMVQSGNWTDHSIPRNDVDGGDLASWVTGNRDMGVAVRSPALAKAFSKVLRADIALEEDAPAPQAAGGGMAGVPE